MEGSVHHGGGHRRSPTRPRRSNVYASLGKTRSTKLIEIIVPRTTARPSLRVGGKADRKSRLNPIDTIKEPPIFLDLRVVAREEEVLVDPGRQIDEEEDRQNRNRRDRDEQDLPTAQGEAGERCPQ